MKIERLLFVLASFAVILGLFSSCEQAAEEVAVSSVTISQPSAEMIIGETLTLTATVSPSNATEQEITWASSQKSVATVDKNGKVDAIAIGETIITATVGGKTAVCQVTVKNHLPSFESVNADKISAISVVLKGKLSLNGVGGLFEYGFMYSTSAAALVANPKIIKAENIDSNSTYSVVLKNLAPETTYYYRSYLYKDGDNVYGETRSFTTMELSTLLTTMDASDIIATGAKLRAKLNLTDVSYETIEYGFFWGTSESSQPAYSKCGEIADNTFTFTLTNLSHKTQYWYKAYVKLDNQSFYGEVKSFITDVVPVENVSLDKTNHTFNFIGNTLMLTATVLPDDATDKNLEWSTDNAEVATVDTYGIVKAVGNGIATITVTTKDQGKTATCEVEVKQYVTGITLNKSSLALKPGEIFILEATVSPANAYDKTLSWTSSNTSVATVDAGGVVSAVASGKTTITVAASDGSGKQVRCAVSVKNHLCPSGAIDLGLSIYWATSNLSISGLCANPEAYGDYYAWGETSPKDKYNWSTYKWCNGNYNSLTKYNNSSSYGTVDNKTVLDSEDDVAHVKLGGNWRMPTDEEWTELRDNCTWTWTSNYNGTGVAGRIVTSNVSGYTDKSIFLPAAGYRSGTSLINAGSYGRYWSSSSSTIYRDGACSVGFSSGDVYRNNGGYYRYYGQSVRPVSE